MNEASRKRATCSYPSFVFIDIPASFRKFLQKDRSILLHSCR